MRYKGEKGSVTLLVTIVCMFVLIMLIIYVTNNKNKMQAQNKEIDKIVQNYEQNEDEVYRKTISELQPIKVGDYINYEPTILGTGENTYTLDANVSGHNTQQIIKQEPDLNWRILRIYEDGSMDLISDSTSATVYFKEARGYNNGVYVMNDICEKLYSNKEKKITARSVNLEDMEKWLTEDGKKAKATSISEQINKLSENEYIESIDKEKNEVTYKHDRSYYPVLWKVQSNESEKHYTENTLITKDELNKSYGQEEKLTVKQTYYQIPINEENYGDGYTVLNTNTNDNIYWVASRFVDPNLYYVRFGLRTAYNEMLGYSMLYSNNEPESTHYRLRAVVSLSSDVQVTPAEGANSLDNPHKIN